MHYYYTSKLDKLTCSNLHPPGLPVAKCACTGCCKRAWAIAVFSAMGRSLLNNAIVTSSGQRY